MKHTKMRWHFLVASHCKGNANSSVDACKGRTNQREKHGDSLDKHEPPSRLRTSEDPRTNNLHHIADWCGRSAGGCGRVPTVEEKVRSKILEEVTERTLNYQGQEYGFWDVAFRVSCLFTQRCDRFETDQNQNRDTRLNHNETEPMRGDDRKSALVKLKGVGRIFGIRPFVSRLVGRPGQSERFRGAIRVLLKNPIPILVLHRGRHVIPLVILGGLH